MTTHTIEELTKMAKKAQAEGFEITESVFVAECSTPDGSAVHAIVLDKSPIIRRWIVSPTLAEALRQ